MCSCSAGSYLYRLAMWSLRMITVPESSGELRSLLLWVPRILTFGLCWLLLGWVPAYLFAERFAQVGLNDDFVFPVDSSSLVVIQYCAIWKLYVAVLIWGRFLPLDRQRGARLLGIAVFVVVHILHAAWRAHIGTCTDLMVLVPSVPNLEQDCPTVPFDRF